MPITSTMYAMVLAVLLTAGFLGVLVAFGALADKLLGNYGKGWAQRLTKQYDEPP